MNQQISDNQNPNEIHYFLWCSHGGTVSAENNLYDVETGVHAVMFYGNQFDIIGSEILSNAFNYNNQGIPTYSNVESLLRGCPTISYQDTVNERVVLKTLLPPIIFSVNPLKDESSFLPNTNNKVSYKDVMGLYHFKVSINNDINKFQVEPQILFNWDDIHKKGAVTYSQIFGLIKKHCTKNNILPAHAIVGIYACRSFIEQYNGDYLPISLNRFLPKFANQNKHMPINLFYTWNSTDPNICISPCLVKSDFHVVTKGWNALATLQHQGCGLNVLSFFSIISQARAREEAVCLSIRGTSIIEICKYINDYLLRMNITRSFIILRFNYEFGIDFLLNFFYKSKGLIGETTIVKFYSKLEHTISGKRKFSNMGHTVAFGVYVTDRGTKIIYFLDPQTNKRENIYEWNSYDTTQSITSDVINQFINRFNVEYGTQFQFMDIIFIFDEKNNFDNQQRACLNGTDVATYINNKNITISSSLYDNDPTLDGKIGIAAKDLAGGMKKRKKKTNKKKLSRKRNTRKRRRYTGGDIFTVMTKKLDKENNVKHLIDN